MIAAGTTPAARSASIRRSRSSGPHREPLIDRDLADRGLAEPEHIGSAIDREVGLRRRIERERRDASDTIEPD